MSEGVRELGREVTGGAQPKKFGDRCSKAYIEPRFVCLSFVYTHLAPLKANPLKLKDGPPVCDWSFGCLSVGL